jgi:hypothetical protein
MPDEPMSALPPPAASGPDDCIRPGAPLDWEALRADGRVHLFFYVRDQVIALALSDALT